MKNLTLGQKIAVGFGVVIALAIILGLIGVVNMNSATTNSERLAKEYVVEVNIANEMERNFLDTRLNMVTYTFTENSDALEDALKSYKEVIVRLEEAKKLAKEYPALTVLAQQVVTAEQALKEYREQVHELETAYNYRVKLRETLDSSVKEYMARATGFLDGQNEKLDRDIRNNAGNRAIRERVEKVNLVNDIIDLGNNLRIANFKSLARRENKDLEEGIKEFEGSFDKTLEKIRKITTKRDDLERLDVIKSAGYSYLNALKEIYNTAEKAKEMDIVLKAKGAEVLKVAVDTSRDGIAGTQKLADSSMEDLMAASTIMIIGLIAVTVLAVVLAFLIIRSVVGSIRSAIDTISNGSNQIVSASNEIASAATSLADSSTQQASAVEEVSATVEESTAIINQSSENAREADLLAKGANEAAEQGNEKVKQLIASMVKTTEASEQIAKIVKTIDEIAFQTNLLALNAAVEAARAGEHGLGFAVVADEVKNLAQRSANAAKETTDIIEEAINQIKNGSSIANATDEAFTVILDRAKKTSDLIGEIAISSREQAEGMTQIASAIGNIDEVTQQNAATSEESAAASEELNAQSVSMMESVVMLATVVGVDVESMQHNSKTPKRKQISKPQTKQVTHRPASSKSKSSGNKSDDIFPLGEDDLKEF